MIDIYDYLIDFNDILRQSLIMAAAAAVLIAVLKKSFNKGGG